jgi:hypothetical protein
MHVVTLTKHENIDFKELLAMVVKQPSGGSLPGNSVNFENMIKDIRLLDVIEPAVGLVFEFEDADWQRLCDKVRAFPFGMADRSLVAFCEAVINAPEKKKPEAKVKPDK